MFVNRHFAYLWHSYLRKLMVLQCETFGTFFYVKTKMLADIQICITVPLMTE